MRSGKGKRVREQVRTETKLERKKSGGAVETVETVDKSGGLIELVWCDHLPLTPIRLLGQAGTVHAYIKAKLALHVVVEERKVKLVCAECWLKQAQIPLFRES